MSATEPGALDLDGWEERAREAVEWGIVYENPEAILALVDEVRALRGERERLLTWIGRRNLTGDRTPVEVVSHGIPENT